MALTQNLGYVPWLDGSTVGGEILRQGAVSSNFFNGGSATAVSTYGGVVNGVGALAVTALTGMNIQIAAGAAVVPNSSSSLQGAYMVPVMSAQTVSVATADPTNPRIDIVTATVADNGNSTSYAYVGLTTGTAAASPSAPSAPANSIVLAQVAVAAGSTSISSGNITDKRTFTAAAGGIVPFTSTSAAVSGANGLLGYDIANGRFFQNAAGGAAQMQTLPWQELNVLSTTNPGTQGTQQTLASATISTDGATDIEIRWDASGFYQNTGSPGNAGTLIVKFYIDSTNIYSTWTSQITDANIKMGGGTFHYRTSSASSDTPSAGSHTVSVQVVQGLSTGGYSIFTVTPHYLRVKPVSK